VRAAVVRYLSAIESKTARARTPAPESPSRKYAAGWWCGLAIETMSTPLYGPPWPVMTARQILAWRRRWQRVKCSPTDRAAYFPVTTVRPGYASNALA
jgi:hypothetical protein